jgi:hypothetical protein
MQILRLIKFSISERSLVKRSSSNRKVCGTISEAFDSRVKCTRALIKSQMFPSLCGDDPVGAMSGKLLARRNHAFAAVTSIIPAAIFFMKNFCSKWTVSSIRSGRRQRI